MSHWTEWALPVSVLIAAFVWLVLVPLAIIESLGL